MSEQTILWIIIVGCIAIRMCVHDICDCIRDIKNKSILNDFENTQEHNENQNNQNESK